MAARPEWTGSSAYRGSGGGGGDALLLVLLCAGAVFLFW